MADPWAEHEGFRGPNTNVVKPGRIHYDTFVVFRPYYLCGACKKVMAQDDFQHPEDDDYVCPHVRRAALEKVMDKIIAGTAQKFSMDQLVMESGVVQVTLVWADVDRPKEEGGWSRPSHM